jgi:hypothetical protein
MDRPLEFYYLIRVIFNLEVNSFLFVDYTISKIDFILFLKRQILEENIFIISFSFNFESITFKLIQ